MRINNLAPVLAVFASLLLAAVVHAAPGATTQPIAGQEPIPLWPGVAPGSEDWKQKEVDYESPGNHKKMVRNVVRPTLTPFFPDPAKANGTAIIIAPGGGFRFHSWENEGTAVAQWLAARGVTAFVLKYRLLDTGEAQPEPGKQPMPTPAAAKTDIATLAIADGRQAMKLVRQRAAEWKLTPNRIGFMGFSAGGVVTMGVITSPDAESRPDFAAPIYGSRAVDKVSADAPPLFLLCASDDKGNADATANLYMQWISAGRSAEVHLYTKGGHGFGMAQRGLPVDGWIERFGEWMTARGLMKAEK